MSSNDPLKHATRSNAYRGGQATRLSDRDTAVYVEDGWIFRVKPGAPIECVREAGRPENLSPVEAPYCPPGD